MLVGAPGDPRSQPRRKGPDLELLGGLREQARAARRRRAAAVRRGGALLEGALSSLLWWEDDALCTTPDEHRAAGRDARAAARDRARARRRGPHARAAAAELAGRETWLTSALHGIRVVSAWVAPRQDAGAGARAPAWREELDRHG